jgi:hypothetical protein
VRSIGYPLAALAAASLLAACGGSGDDDTGTGTTAPQGAAPGVTVLSSKPEYVSGGDALVEVALPAGASASQVSVTLNGAAASAVPAMGAASGAVRLLVSGMKDGANTLGVSVPGSATGTLQVTNYPITGPILSGPHLTPYECRTVESGLGNPLDANCSAARKIEYFYRALDNTYKPLADPLARPGDLRTTVTNDGRTVPYIVRVDSGTINRAIYRIAILDEPTAASVSAAQHVPTAGWNRKLVVSFGGGAGTQYNQGTNAATAPLNDLFLSRGFAHAVSTELVNQQHGNAVLQGEKLMMLKEYFIERYGVPKWTAGSGGSGGAIQQQVITQIYPGLLDGIQPSQAFPDSTLHTPDCGLFRKFFRTADPAVWTGPKREAVEGLTNGTCAAWEASFVPVYTATNAPGCALNDVTKLYHPIYNPKGARCTVQDMRANIYGRQPDTGFARKPQDNVGLQYGLVAVKNGEITPEEFVQLNEGMGGNDIDGGFVANRNVGDPIALKAAYESGLLNGGGGGLANVPILHFRPYTDAVGDIHSRERDFTIRARLQNALGRSDHQVIWVGPRTGFSLAAQAIDTMNAWLDAMAADPAPLSTDKVVRNKPADAVDACFDAAGNRTNEVATLTGTGFCNTLYPPHSEPRLKAGAPLANDVLKCQLKPIVAADYAPATMTTAQLARLRAVFPTGVCDFTKPGVEQTKIKGTYQKY